MTSRCPACGFPLAQDHTAPYACCNPAVVHHSHRDAAGILVRVPFAPEAARVVLDAPEVPADPAPPVKPLPGPRRRRPK